MPSPENIFIALLGLLVTLAASTPTVPSTGPVIHARSGPNTSPGAIFKRDYYCSSSGFYCDTYTTCCGYYCCYTSQTCSGSTRSTKRCYNDYTSTYSVSSGTGFRSWSLGVRIGVIIGILVGVGLLVSAVILCVRCIKRRNATKPQTVAELRAKQMQQPTFMEPPTFGGPPPSTGPPPVSPHLIGPSQEFQQSMTTGETRDGSVPEGVGIPQEYQQPQPQFDVHTGGYDGPRGHVFEAPSTTGR